MFRKLLLCKLFATTIVWGQTGTGTLSGVATCFDYWVPNAIVTITGASNFERTVNADAKVVSILGVYYGGQDYEAFFSK